MTIANGTSSTTVPLFINGREIVAATTFPVNSPLTGKDIYECSSAGVAEAISAIEAAQAAFPAWSQSGPSERRDILLKAAELYVTQKEELWEALSTEMGSERNFFDFILRMTVEIIKDTAGKISSALEAISPVLSEKGASALVFKEPFGVILGIAPWNAAIPLGTRAFLFPIAAGNTCVLKGSEMCPKFFMLLGKIWKEAGLPDGVLNVIYSKPSAAREVTECLIAHPAVKKINFTGSTAVGSSIAAVSGKYLKPVLMELGGKAPAIVLDDADIEKAAFQCAMGAFANGGQICMSTERIIVQKGIEDKFRTALQAVMSAPPFTHSAVLVTAVPVSKNQKLVEDALSKGGKLLNSPPEADESDGNSFAKTKMFPVVIDGVNEKMDLYHTESFGPTVSLLVVDGDEEALKIANDTSYGLSSSVFTEDLRRALRIAKRIESGAVHINSMTVHDEPALPHGGAKSSGWGRFNGKAGLEEFLRTKSVTWKD